MSKKIVLMGNSEVGKTRWINRMKNNLVLDPVFVSTQGVEVRKINEYCIWDTAGNPNFGGLAVGYYLHADMAIVFFDSMKSGFSKEESKKWERDFLRVHPDRKVVYYDVSSDVNLMELIEREI